MWTVMKTNYTEGYIYKYGKMENQFTPQKNLFSIEEKSFSIWAMFSFVCVSLFDHGIFRFCCLLMCLPHLMWQTCNFLIVTHSSMVNHKQTAPSPNLPICEPTLTYMFLLPKLLVESGIRNHKIPLFSVYYSAIKNGATDITVKIISSNDQKSSK